MVPFVAVSEAGGSIDGDVDGLAEVSNRKALFSSSETCILLVRLFFLF